MKPESPFSKLPSLSELLRHPTVQGVVQRVNQTTIAQRATGFWDELQSSWKEQGGMPSVGELAERLAQRLLGRSEHASPTVNATGVVCSRRWQAPLADAATHELLRFASDYQQPKAELMDQVSSSLTKLVGAEAAWVASSYEAAVSLTACCESSTIVTSPLLGLHDPQEFGLEHVDTLSQRIQAGADLVVIDGSGLLGGPRCGIVVGNQQSIAKIREHELVDALAADTMVLAALEATLNIYKTPEQAIHQIPILQLLSTPLENLRQRCERLAPLIAESDAVASAEVMECESVWLDTGDNSMSAKSWAIAVHGKNAGTPLPGLLQRARPQIVGRVESEGIVLDFRAIFTRWDQHLVSALDRTASADNEVNDS